MGKRRPLDPSQPPRRPRESAGNRVVAPLGFQSRPTEVKGDLLEQKALDAIAEPLPIIKDRSAFDAAILDIAGTYARWRDQPPASRSEASYQLHNIAHQAFEARQEKDFQAEASIRRNIGSLNEFATAAWLAAAADTGFVQLPLSSDEPLDLDAIGTVAADAWSRFGAGDYPDHNVAYAIDQLATIFERATDEPATFGARISGAETANGTGSMITTSRCGKMTLLFFEHVHAAIGSRGPIKTKVSNALRTVLRSRRR